MDYNNYGNYPFYPGYVQPTYQQPQVNQNNCQCDNRFMWIQGKEAAKAYPVAPDKTIFFLDDNDSYAYLKKTDRDGRTSEFKVFKLTEEIEEPIVNANSPYVTKEELYSQINELKDLIRQNNKPYNNQRKQVRNDA